MAKTSLKSRLAQRDSLLGIFYKTPSPMIAEVLAKTSLDVIVMDAEHAPFDPLSADQCIAIFRLAGKPVLVRPPAMRPEYVQYALDSGADGILAPHISTPERAQQLVDACYYGKGARGYAGTTRAADFGQIDMASYMLQARSNTAVVAMIEDLEALDCLDQIFDVDGIDAFFIGRADLAAALGESSVLSEPSMAVCEQIVSAARRCGKCIGMFSPNVDDALQWKSMGAHFFFMSSDHALLLQGANRLVSALSGNE